MLLTMGELVPLNSGEARFLGAVRFLLLLAFMDATLFLVFKLDSLQSSLMEYQATPTRYTPIRVLIAMHHSDAQS